MQLFAKPQSRDDSAQFGFNMTQLTTTTWQNTHLSVIEEQKMQKRYGRITGWGAYVPEKIVTNYDPNNHTYTWHIDYLPS